MRTETNRNVGGRTKNTTPTFEKYLDFKNTNFVNITHRA